MTEADRSAPTSRWGDVPVCVAVPTLNEEANLAACLSRLDRFAEIVVIDSGSADATVRIARDHGARVLTFSWDGRFPKKRNWFLAKHPPEQPWVLFLDSDEYVDDAFVDEVAQAVAEADRTDGPDGFWITYDNTFMGAPLRHGLPQRKLALFRVHPDIRYERIDEDGWSPLDMEIHEHPVIPGPAGEIAARVEHRDDRGLARFLVKHVDYARWEAKRFRALQGAMPAHLTGRQRFKYRNLDRWWYPAFYFLYTYVVRLGLLDGAAGYHYAAYKAWYFRTISRMISEESDEKTS
jgi:glycosyltransferase involved in cell wall biosynthesis